MLSATSLKRLQDPSNQRLIVALSGGVDSVALLHMCMTAGLNNVCTVHVNHHLHSDADETGAFCRSLAEELGVDIQLLDVKVDPRGSLEANARQARYSAIEKVMQAGDLLLTAHHGDDQVETIFFQLFRGRGSVGLSGIPRERAMGAGSVYRPLLDIGRADILAYAEQHGLAFKEDPTNEDIGIDRNYIRHELLPRIDQRFPGARQAILAGERRDERARQLLQAGFLEQLAACREAPDVLSLDALSDLSEELLPDLFVAWLVDLELPIPARRMLRELAREIGGGRSAHVTSSELAFHVKEESLYVCRALPTIGPISFTLGESAPDFPFFSDKCVKGKGIKPGRFEVRFRQGGETIRLHRNRTLKNVLQENHVPVWLRDYVPLVCHHNDVIAVSALPDWNCPMIVADGWKTGPADEGLVVECRYGDRVVGQVSS